MLHVSVLFGQQWAYGVRVAVLLGISSAEGGNGWTVIGKGLPARLTQSSLYFLESRARASHFQMADEGKQEEVETAIHFLQLLFVISERQENAK